MSWADPLGDLRSQLSDGATDKLSYRKKVLGGPVDGSTVNFKTLEFRRLSDFTTPVDNCGVFVNGVLVPPGGISVDTKSLTGEFTFAVAPTNGQRIEATYFYQWFTDDELTTFLRLACNWLALGDDFTQIEPGLRPAACDYAQAEAYENLALRWSQRLSEGYQLNDAIDKDRFSIADTYMKWATNYMKSATSLRNDFYSRSGQNEIPAFGNIFGGVRDPVPKR